MKKTILSFILLFAYGLGLAHNSMPHCQDLGKGEIELSHHHHDHHIHDSNEYVHVNHEHVIHNDHLDEGWYDLIFCLISEIEHPKGNCEDNLSLQHFSKNSERKVDQKVVSVFIEIGHYYKDEIQTNVCSNASINYYSSPPLNNFAGRAPPVLSC